jgi:hypothetical protein
LHINGLKNNFGIFIEDGQQPQHVDIFSTQDLLDYLCPSVSAKHDIMHIEMKLHKASIVNNKSAAIHDNIIYFILEITCDLNGLIIKVFHEEKYFRKGKLELIFENQIEKAQYELLTAILTSNACFIQISGLTKSINIVNALGFKLLSHCYCIVKRIICQLKLQLICIIEIS